MNCHLRAVVIHVLMVVGCLLPATAVAQPAAPGSRVLVLPFAVEVTPGAPEGAALWLGEAAALLIADELSRLGFSALPREERVTAFDRLQVPAPAILTRATMIRVGEIIGASEIIFGEVRLGESLAVTARTVHLGAGRSLPETRDEAPLEDIYTLFRRVADRIAGGALPSSPGEVRDFENLSLDVFENYVKGLVASTPASQRRFLELALAGAPHDARVLTALWSVYTAEGEPELALAATSAVPPDDPDARRARFMSALSLIELRRFDGAAQVLAALADQRPSAAVSNALGVVQLQRDPSAPALAAARFAEATDAEPGNTDYLFNRGYAYGLAGDTASALFWLRETVRFDAANGDAHRVMAAVLAGERRAAEAAREWALARLLGAADGELPPVPVDIPEGLERLTGTLDLPGVTLAEAAVANPAQRDQAAAADFHLAQGRRLIDGGRDREALAELRRAIYLSPYDDEPHLLLGRIYHRTGRLAEAIDEFKVAIWSRESVDARLALGEALLEAGDHRAAREEASRALVIAPDSQAARDLLVRAGGAVVPSE